jgi:hypothetical protein
MSPPIRDGSGDSIGSIRLGDGSEISEVRTGAGDVVFSGTAIPDGGLLHGFDFSSSTPLTNVSGNADLTGSYTGTTETINGTQAGEFDGIDDKLEASFTTGDATPVDDYVVFQVDTTADNDYILDGGSRNGAIFYMTSSKWTLFAGTNQSDGSEDTNPHIVRIEWRSGNEILHLDGTDVVNADAGSPDVSGVSIGGQAGGDNYADVNIGAWRRYDPNDSNYNPSQTYQAIADKWGISI